MFSNNGWPGLLFLLLFFTGCVSTTPKNTSHKWVAGPDEASLSTVFREEAKLWYGTPYALGGTSKRGIDCSALVQRVYKDVLDVRLPRTTAQQSKLGTPVQPGQLQVGDLVFYRISAGNRHVGIYVGDNEFMHASKSAGITISSLDDAYWQKRFWMIRRILDIEQTDMLEPDVDAIESGSRVRW